ncbi:MAG: AbrB/MazE/SpoVT family DNA-binding domain-containing protein [Halodesulfurarchaeum sp.]|nr:AbrB/MazE/SpoVT family DNA-binding domain-containing protein [Halodesulfurarchaeum sp.]
MSGTTTTDDRGRIVLPREIREKHGEHYRIVELADRVELIPLRSDPIEGLREAVGDAFAGKSIAEIKAEARSAAQKHALHETDESA